MSLLRNQEFIDKVNEQQGYFTASQASLLAGLSRASQSAYTKNHVFERVEYGIYRLMAIQEPENPELMIAGLKGSGLAVISHLSALAYHGLTQEVPYSTYMKPIGDTSRKRLRPLTRVGISVDKDKDLPLVLESDCWALGDVLITEPSRSVIDCIKNNLIQIESVESLVESGQFNPFSLREDLFRFWEKSSMNRVITDRQSDLEMG